MSRHSFSLSRRAAAALGAVVLAGVLLPAGPATSHAADAAPKGNFRFAAVGDKSLGLWEGDQPVFVYNHGIISNSSAPPEFARSSYVHPIYGLDGEVLTDDFPKDHYHHRGLFWAWPHVKIGGKEYDLWALKGIRHEFVRWLRKDVTSQGAFLAVENGWFVGAEKVVREGIRFRVHPAAGGERIIDVDCEWTPVTEPITLQGAPGKSYGGLTLRFAPGTNTTITIPAGVTREDLPMTNLPWADLTRLWDAEKKTSGAALFVNPRHPDFPPQWLTRHYGVLCIGWPGVKAATYKPEELIQCRYRLWIHRGPATRERLEKAYKEYR